MSPNPSVASFVGNPAILDIDYTPPYNTHVLQNYYHPFLADLEGPGIGYADVNSVQNIILNQKGFLSICGFAVNHPNDFIYRLYAQVILSLLVQNY